MHRYSRALIIFGCLLVLGYTAYFVLAKERILDRGELVLFRLVPVDPRSLLQGDYMRLRYAIGEEVARDSLPPRGYLIFRRDPGGVAQFVRIQAEPHPLAAEEGRLLYRRRRAGAIRPGNLRIGPEDYFFEEGRGEDFAGARYGGMRVDDRGEAVLVGLYDEAGNLIR